jgi:hypothetical protein
VTDARKINLSSYGGKHAFLELKLDYRVKSEYSMLLAQLQKHLSRLKEKSRV